MPGCFIGEVFRIHAGLVRAPIQGKGLWRGFLPDLNPPNPAQKYNLCSRAMHRRVSGWNTGGALPPESACCVFVRGRMADTGSLPAAVGSDLNPKAACLEAVHRIFGSSENAGER